MATILGKEIDWDQEQRIISIVDESTSLAYPINRKVMANNGKVHAMDTVVTIDPKLQRSYLPLRSITESFGYTIDWNTETFTATLYKGGRPKEAQRKNRQNLPHLSQVMFMGNT